MQCGLVASAADRVSAAPHLPIAPPTGSTWPMPIKRRFLRVGDRRVHYFRAGDGPPAVLIHSSPANARFLAKEIEWLAGAHTVFAFDTPGFGLSTPLRGDTLSVADLADALAETLDALAMPRCPIYGTHTGAAIALEFGVRHPARASGLVLDGVPAFTDAECQAYFGRYFQTMPPSELGGHYAEAWTRFRDQSTWFPWTNRTPGNLNRYDLGPPQSTHLWVQMFFEAAEGYAPAYRAASHYGARAIAAAAALTLPVAFCATETDMLYPHLARLPALKPGQEIVDIGSSFERKCDLIAERFARYGADGPAPADRDVIGSAAPIARQFVDGIEGQLHLRYAGDRDAPTLLLLHDAPGSSEQLEPLIAALAAQFFVVAPDLPGNGESDPLFGAPAAVRHVDDLIRLLDRLALDRTITMGVGFGATMALAFADAQPARTAALVVQGLPLPDTDERADWRVNYAPPTVIEADGAHWYRTWLMVRDMQIYFPWYARRVDNLRRVPMSFAARPLHRWTMDVMRAADSHGSLIAAALDVDVAGSLDRLTVPLIQVRDPSTPTSAHDARLAPLRAPAAILAADGPDFVRRLRAAL